MKRLLWLSLMLSLILQGFMSISLHAKELRVGLGELDYPPFYYEIDGNMHGAAIEIARQIARKLNHHLVFKRYPWARVQYLLGNGEIDMMLLYFKTPDRERYVVYSKIPHIYESSYLFTRDHDEISYDGRLSLLKAYSFGNVRGYSHGNEYDSAGFLSKHIVNNEIILIKMLVGGRIDIGVGNKPAILLYAKQIGLHNKIKFISPPIHIAPNYFAFSKTRADAGQLASSFSMEVNKFKKTSNYQ